MMEQEGISTTTIVSALSGAGVSSVAIAKALVGLGVSTTAIASTLSGMGISTTTIASALSGAGASSVAIVQALAGIGVSTTAIASTLASLGLTPTAIAKTLAGMGISTPAIAQALAGMGISTPAIAQALAGAGASSVAIAQALAELGVSTTTIAITLASLGLNPTTIASALSSLGLTPTVIAKALGDAILSGGVKLTIKTAIDLGIVAQKTLTEIITSHSHVVQNVMFLNSMWAKYKQICKVNEAITALEKESYDQALTILRELRTDIINGEMLSITFDFNKVINNNVDGSMLLNHTIKYEQLSELNEAITALEKKSYDQALTNLTKLILIIFIDALTIAATHPATGFSNT